ncbi:MAG: molybdopterin-dependent oxidoreductase, partial [Eggerthellaceae bacterium]|nr:molybdopterin-dependent oxidoreductase [Eggerthellaceae bacterium]
MVERVKTACRACHGGCGTIVTVEDGRVTKIEPDPDAPISKGKLCPKGLAGVELLYHPDRLKYPQKRVGERGAGLWERISWDEAYSLIVDKLEAAKRDFGVQSIAVIQGTGRHHYNHVIRFAHTLGTPNWFEPGGSQCFFPRLNNFIMTYGHPLMSDLYGETSPDCMLVWGSDPTGCSDHGTSQFLIQDTIGRGTRYIVVDPRRTELAEKAEVFLQIRPGTDAALAMAMLNVIINEGLYDQDFVEDWVFGFDELKVRVQEYKPEAASGLTWVAQEAIVR